MNAAKTQFEYVQEIAPSHTNLTSQSIISVSARLLVSMVEADADQTATLESSLLSHAASASDSLASKTTTQSSSSAVGI